ncbi:MAG: NUDIX domain-containing protein [Notoacmeibacter sp.]|nr:NUDIX domain-containing protein [Notoacmeibacter sp.]MCC0032246.1 NUDIX domain-containing protein [Brucellaceae bacterium]
MTEPLADQRLETEFAEPEVLSTGFRRMVRHRLRHRCHDGAWSNLLTRDIHEGAHVAAVLIWDRKADSLVLIRQFRPAAHLATGMGSMLEIVAGGVEAGEDAALAAAREMREETGLVPSSLAHCFDFMASPGITTEFSSLFLAEADSSQLSAVAGEDDDEDIRPVAVPVAEALAALDGNTMYNGFLLMALNWFGRQRASGLYRP